MKTWGIEGSIRGVGTHVAVHVFITFSILHISGPLVFCSFYTNDLLLLILFYICFLFAVVIC